jgi:hypothetical protein
VQRFIEKITSRKFICVLIAAIVPILTVFNVSEIAIEQTVLIISAVGALIVYIFSESSIDRKRIECSQHDVGDTSNDTILSIAISGNGLTNEDMADVVADIMSRYKQPRDNNSEGEK